MHVLRRRLPLSLTVCLLVFGLSAQLRASTSYLVHLQAQSGHYVVAESGANDLLYANRVSPAAWETFELRDWFDGDLISGDEIRWRVSFNARDVISTASYPYGPSYPYCGGSTIHTYTIGLPDCRKYFIYKVDNDGNILWDVPIENGDQVAISSYSGYILSADGGGGGSVTIDRWAIGPWERFFITILCKGC